MKALLIDLDNTLVDRDAAIRAWLIAHGFADALVLLGAGHLSMSRLVRGLMRRHSFPESDPALLARRIRAELPAWLPREPQVRPRLEALASAGLRLALVSNGGGSTQRAKLAAVGLDEDLFGAICISGERRVAKPSPELFHLALAELGVPPAAAMMIGDSPEHDVLGAREAGVGSCWLARGRSFPAQLGKPDWVAADFGAACERLLGAPGEDGVEVEVELG